MDAAFHWNNATRVYSHLRGDLPERIGFANRDVQAMVERCQGCHRQEYAAWRAGPHSATYSRIFLDKTHNAKNMLMDDCLRCHGMHFEGGIASAGGSCQSHGPVAPHPDANWLPCPPCRASLATRCTGKVRRCARPI